MGTSCRCEDRLGLGTLLLPAARFFCKQLGSGAHTLHAGGGARASGPGIGLVACNALLSFSCPRVMLGGVLTRRCEACLALGAHPLPAACPLGQVAGACSPRFLGRGGLTVGFPGTNPTVRALASCHCRRAFPGEGTSCSPEGPLDLGAHPPLPAHPCWALRSAGTAAGCPGGQAPLAVGRGVWV